MLTDSCRPRLRPIPGFRIAKLLSKPGLLPDVFTTQPLPSPAQLAFHRISDQNRWLLTQMAPPSLAIFTVGTLLCAAGATALAQGPGRPYDYTDSVEQICRQYAAAVRGMPTDLMFKQCMSERHCWTASGPAGYQCELPGPMTWHGGGY
jgi:hypothetical protein